jgi:regulator of sirC expression with transglutaminase-like and TPR domain
VIHRAPWWPEAIHNRGLLLGEAGYYGEAITELSFYLALAPDAPNARAIQEKIYLWEPKVGQ